MNPFRPLAEIRSAGAMPKAAQVYLGLGFLPQRRNALEISSDRLPTAEQAIAVAGLDVVLFIKGRTVRYGALRRLCGALLAAHPRRLQLIDLDYMKMAYLKLGSNQ